MPAGLDALCRTPRQQMENEVAWAFNGRQAPAWIHALAEGDQKARTQLAAALDRVHQALVVPNWTRAAAVVEADLALRARALRDGAVHGLLNSLRPILDWAPPVLAAPYPEDRELHLDGRGLCLIPSRFCWAMPVALADPSLPQVLVYPVASAHAAAQPHEGSHPRALATLLGRSRARVLAALDGTTTSELARILALSASSASEHVTALREAGLACSNRIDNRVLHTRSPLGTALLQAQQPTSDDHAQPDGFLQQPRR
ncbi:winged helix-turn-helix domain-containing protein [Streptomyces sp. NPDC001880]